jgi:ComF family protein
MFANLLPGLFHRFPSQCRVCHAWPAQTICEACVAQFAQPRQRCSTCALPLPDDVTQCGACLKNPPPLDLCLAAVAYAFPWSRLIADYKFNDQPGLVRSLTTLLRATPWVEPALERADALLPMPLSTVRLKQRGYNQALLLARQLSQGKTQADLLLRVKDTPAQHTLKRAQRLTSLNDAFAVEPLKYNSIKGARLVLVDDVMTSGASLYAAARVLRAAGAAHITGLIIARTE